MDPPVVGPGGELHYTITITNHGPAASAVLKDQSVRESLEVCKVSNGDPCTFSNHYFDATANLSPFANGESRTISITAKASPTAGDYNRIANAAQVSSGSPEYEDDSASAPVIVRDTADVGISSSVAVSPEGLLQYTHTITNLGPDAAHAVLLIDDLPANTTFASASTTAGECTFYPNLGAHGAVRCPLNNPNAGTPVQVQSSAGSIPSCLSRSTEHHLDHIAEHRSELRQRSINSRHEPACVAMCTLVSEPTEASASK